MHILTGILTSLILTFAAVAQGLPQDVADAYRAYEAAVDAENWAEATAQAETAWRAAEAGDVDAATTTILAANYGEVALISGDNAGAAEAYERAAEIMGRRHEDVETRANYLRMAAQAYYAIEDYNRANRLASRAVDQYERMPDSEARWSGIYFAQSIRAYSLMNQGNAIRGGHYAGLALESLARVGTVANNDTASLSFLAGLNAALNRRESDAAYYFTLSSYINDAIGSGEDASRIARAWARYIRGRMEPEERAELLGRLQLSGYQPADCSIGMGSCYDDPDWVAQNGGDGVAVDAVPRNTIPPDYPEDAQRAGLDGLALVRYTISSEGRATDAEIIYSVPYRGFGDAGIDVLRRWRFDPATVNGQPVDRPDRIIQFEFEMAD